MGGGTPSMGPGWPVLTIASHNPYWACDNYSLFAFGKRMMQLDATILALLFETMLQN
jgi:hypothetical protein